MEKESIIEKISGNPLLNLGTTALSAAAGGPLAALLPLLAVTPAALRHNKRIEKAFEEINLKLNEMGSKLNDISDSHYKLVNEVVSSILRTTDEKKIDYLKKAIKNGLEMSSLDEKSATSLSRIIRDITANEVAFLLKSVSYKLIYVNLENKDDGSLTVCKNTNEYELLSGLLALGLVTLTSTHAAVDAYYFSSIAYDVVNIFKD